jgi:hypothetical protein
MIITLFLDLGSFADRYIKSSDSLSCRAITQSSILFWWLPNSINRTTTPILRSPNRNEFLIEQGTHGLIRIPLYAVLCHLLLQGTWDSFVLVAAKIKK